MMSDVFIYRFSLPEDAALHEVELFVMKSGSKGHVIDFDNEKHLSFASVCSVCMGQINKNNLHLNCSSAACKLMTGF